MPQLLKPRLPRAGAPTSEATTTSSPQAAMKTQCSQKNKQTNNFFKIQRYVQIQCLSNANIIIANFPSGSEVKNSPANAGDMRSIPGWGRSLGERNGNPFLYSCLGNPTDRGDWRATVHEVAKELDTT